MTDALKHSTTPTGPRPRRRVAIRLAELAVGFTTNAVMNWAFDWVLYPYAIFTLGLLWGGLVMSIASFVSCLGVLWLYDLLKRDWLGIEAVRALRLEGEHTGWRRLVAGILRRGDAAAFVFLSLQFDPFITTAYMRHGRFNGMGRRDWAIFIGSWVLGNGSWMLACWTGVEALTWMWGLISPTS